MKRISRPLAVLSATALASTGLLLTTATSASAAVLGNVTINPTSGTDATSFGGTTTTGCPSGTLDSGWYMDGPDVTDVPLGATVNNGIGPQSFANANIANLRTANGGYATPGVNAYTISLKCLTSSGTDSYTARMDYNPASGGSWTIFQPPRDTTTSLVASPASPQEQGTNVTFTADVTPTSGADNPTGTVQFYDGAATLGAPVAVSATGVAAYSTAALSTGAHTIKATYLPGSTAFTTSTSPNVPYTINPVAARPTTSVLTVSGAAQPATNAAYAPTTFTCDVTPSTGVATGTVAFKDGASTFATATTGAAAGAATRYTATTSSIGPGVRSFTCAFTGTAPYQDSTSAAVVREYVVDCATCIDEQTVTVTIPTGALSITTPYTPADPLSLGTAVLDPADSTYSASAQFGTAAKGYITVTDSRAGNLGWTASVNSGAFSNGVSSFSGLYAGLTGLQKVQVAGNALQASDVTVTNHAPFTDGLDSTKPFASYPANKPTGTANLYGTFGIDQVPTSVTPGLYTATVVFTVA